MPLPIGDDVPPTYQSTECDRVWKIRRIIYYAVQLTTPLLIGARLGPNLLLFHSPFRPGPSAYVSDTRPFVPTIAAIKAYQRDHGELPEDVYGLQQTYLPANYDGNPGEIVNTSITFGITRSFCVIVLEYQFAPDKEGWYLHAPGYDGPLGAPIVPAAAATQSTSAPVEGTHP